MNEYGFAEKMLRAHDTLEAELEEKKKVITPGGRVGDDAHHNRSPKENWVDKRGGLPDYIRIVRNGMVKDGMDEGKATAMAIAAVKRWAAGRGDVSEKVRAAAAKAVAQWEAMKGTKVYDDILLEMKGYRKIQPRKAGYRAKKTSPGKRQPGKRPAPAGQPGKRVVRTQEGARRYGVPIGRPVGEGHDDEHEGDKKKPDNYTIKHGDTLSELAERFGTTVAEMMKANPDIKDADLIYTGHKLNLPGSSAKKTAGKKTPGRKMAAKKQLAKKTTAKKAPAKKKERVKYSDLTLAKAAKRRGITITQLLRELAEKKSNESSFQDDWADSPTMLAATTETKGSTTMQMEHKSVGVSGLNVVDETKGIVETIVSVTGIVDNVKDIIEPGAYTKSLNTRIPKGVWSHSWDTPVARTEEVKELMPGDERLPSQLPNGQPWPDSAGALLVKTQFNLGTQRGREAYSDVTFFGDQQEWSIGYQVPVGGATVDSKTGQRSIQTLELYEYSPVLFGAMPHARSLAQTGAGVKDAQIAFKTLTMPELELKEWASGLDIDLDAFEVKSKAADKDADAEEEEVEELFLAGDGEEGDEEEADEEPDDDEDDADEEKSLSISAYEREVLVKTHQEISVLLGLDYDNIDYKAAGAADEDPDAEGGDDEEYEETSSLSDVVSEYEEVLKSNDLGDMVQYANDFDSAVDDDDLDMAEEAANAILDMIEGADEPEGDLAEAFSNVARAIADMAPEVEAEEEEPAEDAPVDEEDTEKKDEEKSDTIVIDTKMLDTLRAGLTL